MIDLTKKYRTRNGKIVTQLTKVKVRNSELTIAGLVDETLMEWYSDGKMNLDETDIHPFDLFEVKDVTLPYELAIDRDLSLEEIGAIFKSFASLEMTSEELIKSFKDGESKSRYFEIIEDLVTRDIVSIVYDENNHSIMTINLETVNEIKPFWEIEEECDDYGNMSYFHIVGHDEDYGDMKYMVRPIVVEMTIQWSDCSDCYLNLGYIEPFKSLEDAEKYYRALVNTTFTKIPTTNRGC